MKNDSPDARLRRDLRQVFRSMDSVSRHPALKRDTAEARRLAAVQTNALQATRTVL